MRFLAISALALLITTSAVAQPIITPSVRPNVANATGTLPVANGGTGAATLTGLVKGNGTGAMTAATPGSDYQAPPTTGSWTPTFYGTSTAGSPTYSVQYGYYYKIGTLVIAPFSIRLSAVTGMVGSLGFSGLPVTSANVTSPGGCVIEAYQGLTFTAGTELGIEVTANATTAQISTAGSGAANSNITIANTGATSLIRGTCIYEGT